MAISLRNGLCLSGYSEVGKERKEKSVGEVEALLWKNEFRGQNVIKEQSGAASWMNPKDHSNSSIRASICIRRPTKWWENSMQPNMVEITSANHLVQLLASAGDKLVIVDFYSPACGSCRALHPKMCQLVESNPDAVFLKVNYEEHMSICQNLGVHVLPFFGSTEVLKAVCVCSFSCTNATIIKFKDALAKHGDDQCSFGLANGLEEEELLCLDLNREARSSLPPIIPTMGNVPAGEVAASGKASIQ